MTTATLYERLLSYGDNFAGDGGYCDPLYMLKPALDAYEAGFMTQSDVHWALGCSSAQSLDCDVLLNTMPAPLGVLSGVLAGAARLRWAEATASVFRLGQAPFPHCEQFNTPEKCLAALGLS